MPLKKSLRQNYLLLVHRLSNRPLFPPRQQEALLKHRKVQHHYKVF
jgi:hypothetical protein